MTIEAQGFLSLGFFISEKNFCREKAQRAQKEDELSTEGTEDTERKREGRKDLETLSLFDFEFSFLCPLCLLWKNGFPFALSCAFSWPTILVYFAATAGNASHKLSARIGNIVPL